MSVVLFFATVREALVPLCLPSSYGASSGFVLKSFKNFSRSSRLTKIALAGLYAGNRLLRIHDLIVSFGTFRFNIS